MTHRVTLPNGQIEEFPDEATPEQMQTALSEKYGNSQSKSQLKQHPITSALRAFNARGGELPRGILQALTQGGALGERLKQGVERQSAYHQNKLAAAQQANPLAAMLGGFGGSIAGESPLYAIPGLGQGTIPRLASQGALQGGASGLLNETQNGESRIGKGLFGASVGSASGGLGGLVSSGIRAIKPQSHAEKIIEELGGGKRLTESSKEGASIIRDTFKNITNKISEDFYNPVFKATKKENIYAHSPYDIAPNKTGYMNLEKNISKNYDSGVNKIHEVFLRNPNLKNAHKLQSKLGYLERSLEKQAKIHGPDAARDLKVGEIKLARDTLKSDMDKYLGKINPEYARLYKQGTEEYAKEAGPYLKNPILSQISRGIKKNPKNLAGLFAKPEEDIEKVAKDIGEKGRNRILFSSLGKLGTEAEAKDVLAGLKGLQETGKGQTKGLSYLMSPDLSKNIKSLGNKVAMREIAQSAAGMAGGALIGGPLGMIGELAGAGVGGFLGPKILGNLPKSKLGTKLGNLLREAPDLIRSVMNTQAGNQ